MGRGIPPILLAIIGLFVGIIVMIIFNYIKRMLDSKKIENMALKAKEEAD